MLKFDRQGLVPVVIQDDATNEVLMVAFMNEEAFERTRETGYTHFFSRSRNKIWPKGATSGNTQAVCGIFINCEENSLLIRVEQHGGAACHTGYKSCYYRRLQPDATYQTIAERVFDPALVYATASAAPSTSEKEQSIAMLETSETPESSVVTLQQAEQSLRQLYGAYLYLRDHDLTSESNTSRLLHEKSHGYLTSRLADELQELAGVQSGEHSHSGREADTILEGSQVGYWLLLLASTGNVRFNDFSPQHALLAGYRQQYSEEAAVELRQECLNLLATNDPAQIIEGLQRGFAVIGWACAAAGISPLAPTEYDLAQMRRKGLV